MLTCEQTKGQSVFQHGQSVREHFLDLIEDRLDVFRIPEWFTKYKEKITSNFYSKDVVEQYLVFHDCGKPNCKTIDNEGKTHFPNHAEVSKETYLKYDGNVTVANLIGWDMVVHTATSEEIKRYLENVWTKQDALTLLVAALAEVHSNAKLFDGIESVSFKSKWKKIDKRGNQICKHFFEEK